MTLNEKTASEQQAERVFGFRGQYIREKKEKKVKRESVKHLSAANTAEPSQPRSDTAAPCIESRRVKRLRIPKIWNRPRPRALVQNQRTREISVGNMEHKYNNEDPSHLW